MSWNQKRQLETVLHQQILLNPQGIDTRTLITQVINMLSSQMPLTRQRVSGMLGWVIKRYGHQFLVRQPGGPSVIR